MLILATWTHFILWCRHQKLLTFCLPPPNFRDNNLSSYFLKSRVKRKFAYSIFLIINNHMRLQLWNLSHLSTSSFPWIWPFSILNPFWSKFLRSYSGTQSIPRTKFDVSQSIWWGSIWNSRNFMTQNFLKMLFFALISFQKYSRE